MDAQEVRSEADRRLFEELVQHEDVQRIQARLGEHGRLGTRRNLLARALRLTGEIAPVEHGLLQASRERLGVETEVELFVYPSAEFNAGCTQPEDGRVFVLVSSSLLESFEAPELRYVLGHELGHHLYGHHSLPLPALVANAEALDKRLVLRAHSWQRHAEISADRAGLLCCEGDLDGAARSLFKLSSGLRAAPGPEQIEAFLDQAMELYAQDELDSSQHVEHQDWLSSHPFSPLRLRALASFANSDVFAPDGTPMTAVEMHVEDLMSLMEPSYLEEDSAGAEAMRRLLFAAGAVVAGADGVVVREEIEALSSLLGPGKVPRTLNVELLSQHLPDRIKAVRSSCRWGRRAQLIRDLAVIARADGRIHTGEVEEMIALARSLDVDEALVHVALEMDGELD
ncbi:MAG TPA: M48 family metallopeptidase [Myxococcota bacterium]|nr:M48 family metallopeptidase [Myxococcota bacterium]